MLVIPLEILLLSLQLPYAKCWSLKQSRVTGPKTLDHQHTNDIEIALRAHPDVKQWIESVVDAGITPSCSGSSVKAWTVNCKILAESEQLRMEMAATLAYCEIKGVSSLSVPRECEDWVAGRGQVNACIDALSRSPQYWSSYTSFHRDVVQTCFALESWHDTEAIKQLYSNLSHAQTDLIHRAVTALREGEARENAAERSRERWQTQADEVVSKMQSNVDDFSPLMKSMEDVLQGVARTLRTHRDEAEKQKQEIEAMSKAVHTSTSLIPKHINEQSVHFQQSIASTLREASDMQLQVYEQHLRENLDFILQEHQAAFSGLSMTVHAVERNLAELGVGIKAHQQDLLNAQEATMSLAGSLSYLSDVLMNTTQMALQYQMYQESSFERQYLLTEGLANATSRIQSQLEGTRILDGYLRWVWWGILGAIRHRSFFSWIHARTAMFGFGATLILRSIIN